MRSCLQTDIDIDEYNELIANSRKLQSEKIGEYDYEGRRLDNGELIVLVKCGPFYASVYCQFPSFSAVFSELREGFIHASKGRVGS